MNDGEIIETAEGIKVGTGRADAPVCETCGKAVARNEWWSDWYHVGGDRSHEVRR